MSDELNDCQGETCSLCGGNGFRAELHSRSFQICECVKFNDESEIDKMAGFKVGYEAAWQESAAELSTLKADLKEAKELLKPFASFTGKENYIDDGIDIIGEKGVCGNYCVPDSHGFEVIWADENNGQTVHFTAGQFRRVRAFLKDKADG